MLHAVHQAEHKQHHIPNERRMDPKYPGLCIKVAQTDPAEVVVRAAGARMQGRQHHQSRNADAKHHLHAEMGELQQHDLVHSNVVNDVVKPVGDTGSKPPEEAESLSPQLAL